MPLYLNPDVTIARAGPVLEREFRQRFGEQEYERMYRVVDFAAQEHATNQEQQVQGTIFKLIEKRLFSSFCSLYPSMFYGSLKSFLEVTKCPP